MSSLETRSVGGTPRSSFDAIVESFHFNSSSSSSSIRPRRSSIWKNRVTSLYSSPKQQKHDDDDGPDEDMWDNNDYDFKQQVLFESRRRRKDSIQSNLDQIYHSNTSMEEVSSPKEITSFYSADRSSPQKPFSASSSTPTLNTSFPNSPSFSGGGGTLSTWNHLPSNSKTLQNTSMQRPSSTTDASLLTSKSNSTLFSEASTAPTFPSPASSKAELRARQRLSNSNGVPLNPFLANGNGGGGGLGSAGSISDDGSPISASFDCTKSLPSSSSPNNNLIHEKTLRSNTISALSNTLQFGGWTQEQIDSPGADMERYMDSLSDSFGNQYARPIESTSLTNTIASATVDDVRNARYLGKPAQIISSSPISKSERPDLEEDQRGIALNTLNGHHIESEKSLPPTPPPKDNGSKVDQSLFSGFKKKFSIKQSPNNNNKRSYTVQTNTVKPTDYGSIFSNHPKDRSTAIPIPVPDQHRRPSLPHLNTMPSLQSKRRLSMQHSPGFQSNGMEPKSPLEVEETLTDSCLSEDLGKSERMKLQRRPSMESLFNRMIRPSDSRMSIGSIGSNGSNGSKNNVNQTFSPRSHRNSIIEHTSFDQVRRRGSIVSNIGKPVFGLEDDVCEELQVDSTSLKAEDEIENDIGRRLSISSNRSINPNVPLRPPRYDEGERFSRRPSMDSINSVNPSLERSFNVAHKKRWSTVGPAFLTYIDPRKTDAIETSNPQMEQRPVSPFENIFKGTTTRSDNDATSSVLTRVQSHNPNLDSSSPSVNIRNAFLNARLNSSSSALNIPNGNEDEQKSREEISDSSAMMKKSKSVEEKIGGIRKNRLSSFLKSAGLTKKPSRNQISKPTPAKSMVNVNNSILTSPLDGFTTENSLNGNRMVDSNGGNLFMHSPASISLSGSIGNRSSGGGSSLNPQRQTPIENDEMESESKRNSGLNMIRSESQCSIKRPTFGLDLQPDAAAAFDSIPLPETPERIRSRTPSFSSNSNQISTIDHLTLPPPIPIAKHNNGSVNGSQSVSDIDSESNGIDHTNMISSDLPADVEDDFEDLLSVDEESDVGGGGGDSTLTGDETLLATSINHSSSSIITPSAFTDEVELLEDEDDVMEKEIELQQLSNDSIESQQQQQVQQRLHASLNSYRFPPVVMNSSSSRCSSEDHRSESSSITSKKNSFYSEDFTLPIVEKNSNSFAFPILSNNNNLHQKSIQEPILASHLRRPSSSASYI